MVRWARNTRLRHKPPPYGAKKNARDLKAAGENPGFRRKLEETV
jgi:hypothetical protein